MGKKRRATSGLCVAVSEDVRAIRQLIDRVVRTGELPLSGNDSPRVREALQNGKTLGHAAGGEKRWADVPLIGVGGWGDAVLDRLVHNAHKLELKGDSLRKKGGKT